MEWVMQDRRVAFGKAPSNQAFSRGQKQILVLLAFVTLFVYGALAMFVAQVRPWSAPVTVEAAMSVSGELGLQVAHDKAQAWALSWQPDAQLVSAAARWQLTGGERLTPDRATWSFTFYSPAARQVQMLTVDDAGTRPVRQVSVSQAPVPVSADWSLNSDDLLVTFLAHGGEQFIRRHAHTSVHFRLSAQDSGQAIWYLTAIAPEARQTFVVGVDALSRKVVLTD